MVQLMHCTGTWDAMRIEHGADRNGGTGERGRFNRRVMNDQHARQTRQHSSGFLRLRRTRGGISRGYVLRCRHPVDVLLLFLERNHRGRGGVSPRAGHFGKPAPRGIEAPKALLIVVVSG